jgi:hypothetical protein
MSNERILAVRAIASITISLPKTTANIISGPDAIHSSSRSLLFGMDTSNIFLTLCRGTMADSEHFWPSSLYVNSYVARPMAGLGSVKF